MSEIASNFFDVHGPTWFASFSRGDVVYVEHTRFNNIIWVTLATGVRISLDMGHLDSSRESTEAVYLDIVQGSGRCVWRMNKDRAWYKDK